jgi:hypothetical protein
LRTFHFNFQGESYNAQATIENNNGKMCCDISSILEDKSDQQVTFKGFLLGPLVLSEDPLSKAISLGLKQYLNYYPI